MHTHAYIGVLEGKQGIMIGECVVITKPGPSARKARHKALLQEPLSIRLVRRTQKL